MLFYYTNPTAKNNLLVKFFCCVLLEQSLTCNLPQLLSVGWLILYMVPTLKKEKRTSTYSSTNIILVLINMLIRTLEIKLDRLHKSCSAVSSFHLVPHFEECSPIISRAFSSSFFLVFVFCVEKN
jgi:hypothetical protein